MAAQNQDTNAIHLIFGPVGHEMISPDFVSKAAPTLNLEYGDTDPSRAFAAAATSFLESIFTIQFCHRGAEAQRF